MAIAKLGSQWIASPIAGVILWPCRPALSRPCNSTLLTYLHDFVASIYSLDFHDDYQRLELLVPILRLIYNRPKNLTQVHMYIQIRSFNVLFCLIVAQTYLNMCIMPFGFIWANFQPISTHLVPFGVIF